MEDRFKFRVFDYDKNKMVYFSSLIGIETPHHDRSSQPNLYNDYVYHKISNYMQSTGLKDRNGKLIYEGDMLRYPAKNQYEERCYTFFEVFWHDNDCCDNHIGWQMNRLHPMGGLTDCSRNHKFIPRITEQMEIIGNIYENKELLGEQK